MLATPDNNTNMHAMVYVVCVWCGLVAWCFMTNFFETFMIKCMMLFFAPFMNKFCMTFVDVDHFGLVFNSISFVAPPLCLERGGEGRKTRRSRGRSRRRH